MITKKLFKLIWAILNMEKSKILKNGVIAGFLGGMVPAIAYLLIKGSELDPLLFGIFMLLGAGLAFGFARYFYFKN